MPFYTVYFERPRTELMSIEIVADTELEAKEKAYDRVEERDMYWDLAIEPEPPFIVGVEKTS